VQATKDLIDPFGDFKVIHTIHSSRFSFLKFGFLNLLRKNLVYFASLMQVLSYPK
jgi:hypothetical protein